MDKHEVLKRCFGYDAFRNGQEALIDSILSARDVLGVMPTGAGKSLCFQIPAILLGGISLVISPLISLMKDQVNALNQSGIAAAYLNSSLTPPQFAKAMQNARNGAYKLIYVAPERLLAPAFLEFARAADISMLTVDEAHCISQWGQDFRPSYSQIPAFIAQLGKRPVISAFTATATPRVREDIVELLELENPSVLITGFDRQNLYFEVQHPQDKYAALKLFLSSRKQLSGIVYCSTRAAVEEVCEQLCKDGFSAARYHAGLSDEERIASQDDFLFDRVQIIVATNAFGMGIDKSNVAFVVHYNMPKDIESYYQEAGRAGRDGSNADCLLLYSGKDVRTNQWLIENAKDMEYPDVETERMLKERDRKRLREMTFYCTTDDCLRGYMLKYFGETPMECCDNCGNCVSNYERVDITLDAQKILSCVARAKERFGAKMIVDILRGSKGERLLRLGLEKLSTYGISNTSAAQLHKIINHLALNGYLSKTDDEYPVLKLGSRAAEILREGETLSMKLPRDKLLKKRSTKKSQVQNPALFEELRKQRLIEATMQKVPAFTIFTDSTLKDMCEKMPATAEEFLDISGVGKVKLERYGKRFLKAIADFRPSDE